jgi:poly(beta-D-mannuronate) lyase
MSPMLRARLRKARTLLAMAALVFAGGCQAGDADEPKKAAPAQLALAASAVPVAARGSALQPPAGFMVAAEQREKKPRDCPSDAQPFTGALDFPSRYEGSDKARDDLNEKAEKEYKRLTLPITTMEKALIQQVDDYMRSGNAAALSCATGMLRSWSGANALMGEALTHTGKSMRKWAMASVAAAYLRLKFSASQPLAQDPDLVRSVDKWLEAMATRVMQEWADQPLEKVNNHEYWAAWAVMAASVAVNRRDLYDWSIKQFDTATQQVTAEGFLPNELARDTRALTYHNYALPPLMMIAAFAKANGQTPDEAHRAALARLVERVLDGVEDPEEFEGKTGKKQVETDFTERSKFAWLEPYCWTFSCSAQAQGRLDALRPVKSTRLGGNLTDIFGPHKDARPKSASQPTAS